MKLHACLGLSLAVTIAAMGAACSSGSTSGGGTGDSGAGADTGTGSDTGSGGDTGGGGDTGTGGDTGAGGDTWANWAQGFFTKYCIECHTATDPQGHDFTTLAGVVKDKATIRCGVSVMQDPSWSCAAFPPPKQFPINDMAGTNPKPTDAERNRAVAWIGAGCP
jgi:hypothetical protein